MTTNDTRPTGYDTEGHPMFEPDELDRQYSDLIERIRDRGHDSWAVIDQAIGELLSPSAALGMADEVLEVAAALVQRERGRARLWMAELERRLEDVRRGLPD